jgi:hypothetical protein
MLETNQNFSTSRVVRVDSSLTKRVAISHVQRLGLLQEFILRLPSVYADEAAEQLAGSDAYQLTSAGTLNWAIKC